MQEDIIIIGAGPSGLMAAYELAKAHRQVLIIEARDRIGGRAHTLSAPGVGHIETGSEFVHGELPITLELLREAGLRYTATSGRWIQIKSGASTERRTSKDWSSLLRKLKSLKNDMTLQDFLELYFPGSEYAALKDHAIGFAEGYDSADASRVSAKALYEEWSKEDEEQFRIDKGYTALMGFLASRAGCNILLSHPVSAISIKDGHVAITAAGSVFTAARVIIALPLGVLQQEKGIRWSPNAMAYHYALLQLGMGDVIKFVFRFKDAFWEREYPGLGFLISGAEVPTWWTQAPDGGNVLTGWLSGRAAKTHSALNKDQLQGLALQSLSRIFNLDVQVLESTLVDAHVINWSADPFALGSYAYATVGAAAAREALIDTMSGSIFFAGEYMYDGPAMGTVEAAFASGRDAAMRLLGGMNNE